VNYSTLDSYHHPQHLDGSLILLLTQQIIVIITISFFSNFINDYNTLNLKKIVLKLCVNRARKTQMRIQKTAHYRFADISYGENQNSSIQSSWSFEQHLNHCKLQYPADTFPTFEFFEQSECLIASHASLGMRRSK